MAQHFQCLPAWLCPMDTAIFLVIDIIDDFKFHVNQPKAVPSMPYCWSLLIQPIWTREYEKCYTGPSTVAPPFRDADGPNCM